MGTSFKHFHAQNLIGSLCKKPTFTDRFLAKFKIYRQIITKFFSAKFHKNPFNRSRVVTCVKLDGQADMIKLKDQF